MDKDLLSRIIVFSEEIKIISEARKKGIVIFDKSQINELLEEVVRRFLD